MGSHIIRVLAVDHNPLMREGLAILVRLQADMQLVGAVATAGEAVQMYLEERPDVTLTTISGSTGLVRPSASTSLSL